MKSTKSYVSKLEQQLKDEIEKRSKLEQEINEMKRLNLEMAKKIGVKWGLNVALQAIAYSYLFSTNEVYILISIKFNENKTICSDYSLVVSLRSSSPLSLPS